MASPEIVPERTEKGDRDEKKADFEELRHTRMVIYRSSL